MCLAKKLDISDTKIVNLLLLFKFLCKISENAHVLPNLAASLNASLQLALSQSDKMLCVKSMLSHYSFFKRWKFLRPCGSKRP